MSVDDSAYDGDTIWMMMIKMTTAAFSLEKEYLLKTQNDNIFVINFLI